MLYFQFYFAKRLIMKANSTNFNTQSKFISYSYKNFIVLGAVFALFYALCFFVMRVVLAFDTFDIWQNDFGKMFLMGFRLDMRAICVVCAFILLLGYAVSACKGIFHTINARNLTLKANTSNSTLGGGGINTKVS